MTVVLKENCYTCIHEPTYFTDYGDAIVGLCKEKQINVHRCFTTEEQKYELPESIICLDKREYGRRIELKKCNNYIRKQSFFHNCSTCKNLSKVSYHYDYDVQVGICEKIDRYIVPRDGKIFIDDVRGMMQIFHCHKYEIKPKKCSCGFGPIITKQLSRCWDNGGWWYRTLCCDCLKGSIDSTSYEESIINWNNNKFKEK